MVASSKLGYVRFGCPHLQTLLHLGAFDARGKTTLPPLFQDAQQASETKAFGEAVEPLLQLIHCDQATFASEFCRVYCAVRRLGLPLWNEQRQGAALIARSPYGAPTAPAGDILGVTPFIDQVRHSSLPNVSVGTPSAEAQEWMALNLGTKAGVDYMVLQAARAIMPGEVITMDRNLSFGFDAEQFASWFGEPYDPSKSPLVAVRKDADRQDAKPSEVTTDADIFF